ncbi:endonuclease/exonuclease/phosphatase family protein [Halomonas sp. KO116]|uniref:endonuclease/exonuclease/phosphatase family protein n=1 Tax=Halomonas sp. KO116 TaxID=1504981 RepID=UPI0004E45843|nr:endonuclease/exonuclease/phosphatase family protein [Halomonas sp. KO116]AJY53221.1 Endonuclease/exonuclease/phosphatase [Halomonas sp. KO116]
MQVFKQLCRAALASVLVVAMPAFGDISIATWNLKNTGWNNGKDFGMVAHIAQEFDFLAVQEIMSEEGAENLHQALEGESGESWDYMVSHLIGRGSYREAYGFFWRETAVEYVDGAVVFLDTQDVYSREPLSARFRSRYTGDTFAVGNIHVLYGKSVSDRLPEINALEDYWEWLAEVYPGTPRLLVGDFNLDSRHRAFQSLLNSGAVAAVYDGNGTTLSTIEGRYPNHYDHIFLEPAALNVTSRGILRFPSELGISNQRAREVVSDHVPVWIALGSAPAPRLESYHAGAAIPATAANDAVYDCVDLNRSDANVLGRLPHIGEVRAQTIIEGRPWASTQALTSIRGLSDSRVNDILESQQLCSRS